MVIEINDLNHPALDVYTRLTDAQLRSKLEPEKGVFIAESAVIINQALDRGCEPVSMLMERRHLDGQGAELIARCPEIPVYTADSAVLEQLTGFPMTRGIIAAFRRPAPTPLQQILTESKRIAVLEGIVDGANVGAIFRSAAALGVDAVLLSPTCIDPLCRRSIRVSMGTVFCLPWTRIGEKNSDWPESGIRLLHEAGFHTAALALEDHSIPIDAPSLAEKDRLAFILGSEGNGLMRETIDACRDTVLIPMSHGVNSLNVAAAAAVAFWTLCRH